MTGCPSSLWPASTSPASKVKYSLSLSLWVLNKGGFGQTVSLATPKSPHFGLIGTKVSPRSPTDRENSRQMQLWVLINGVSTWARASLLSRFPVMTAWMLAGCQSSLGLFKSFLQNLILATYTFSCASSLGTAYGRTPCVFLLDSKSWRLISRQPWATSLR